MTVKQKSEIMTVILTMREEKLENTESFGRLQKIYEKWIMPKQQPGQVQGRDKMDFKNKTYNRGGLWSPGSWSTETSTGGNNLHVILHGREKDRRFWISCKRIEAEIQRYDKNAFESDNDFIWFVLNRIYNNNFSLPQYGC